MSQNYPNLLSPLKVGNFILKNRMESSNSMPHFLQGSEPYPASSTIIHYANRARSGASIVTIGNINCALDGPDMPMDVEPAHYPTFNIYNSQCQNYIIQLTEAIHYYNSIVCAALFTATGVYPIFNQDGSIEKISAGGALFDEDITDGLKTISEETMNKIADSFAQQCKILQSIGIDMISLHFAYRFQLPGKFLSPLTNKRKDKFGGCIENRARFPLMILERIRNYVGKNFIIEVLLSGEEPEGGNTLDDTVEFLKMAEKYIDIVQVRSGELDPNHPTGFILEETPYLKQAEYIKKSGVDILIANVGGWQNPESAEKAVAEGKLDIVSMARAWISNPDYGQLVYNGKKDDIIPCIRCNKCHQRGPIEPFASTCSVNPLIGIEHMVETLARKPSQTQKIAIIGGGPAGMKAAIDLYDRGHDVTIYEATDQLGGAIKHADYVDFKWPLRDFKKYLIHQIIKRDIVVNYNTVATPEMIKYENYDSVITAIGAEPAKPRIPGIEKRNVYYAVDAILNPDCLGKDVVVIGGGEVGVEAGMVLASKGHNVTVLEMREKLAADSAPTHYRSMFESAWEVLPEFHSIVNARCTSITDACVNYIDSNGKENSISVDNIVISAGMTAKKDEALSFYGIADRFYMIGDCRKPATVQQAMRSAYATASTI